MKYRVHYRTKASGGLTTRAETVVEADSLKGGLSKFIETNPFSLIYSIEEVPSKD